MRPESDYRPGAPRPRASRAAFLAVVAVPFAIAASAAAARAQVQPPRPVSIFVSPAQGLAFGAFFQGASGGTITVNYDGSRMGTGSVIPAGFGVPYSAALFELDAEPGTVISIMSGGAVTLSGSNGGIMELTPGAISTGSSFVSTALPPARTAITVGGTLDVGDIIESPPGNYAGSFDLIFFQQ